MFCVPGVYHCDPAVQHSQSSLSLLFLVFPLLAFVLCKFLQAQGFRLCLLALIRILIGVFFVPQVIFAWVSSGGARTGWALEHTAMVW